MSKQYIAKDADIIGDVQMGEDVNVWYHATIRADAAKIMIGNRSNIQDNCVLHVDEGFPLTIGEYVTVGHGAILHGCSIGDNTVIGMGAILLNGCKIGKNCIVGAHRHAAVAHGALLGLRLHPALPQRHDGHHRHHL